MPRAGQTRASSSILGESRRNAELYPSARMEPSNLRLSLFSCNQTSRGIRLNDRMDRIRTVRLPSTAILAVSLLLLHHGKFIPSTLENRFPSKFKEVNSSRIDEVPFNFAFR